MELLLTPEVLAQLRWLRERSSDWLADELTGYWSELAAMELRRRGWSEEQIDRARGFDGA